jgi:hypothetical protein
MVSGREPQCSAYLCGDDQSPLLSQHQRGIHKLIMSRSSSLCHNRTIADPLRNKLRGREGVSAMRR